MGAAVGWAILEKFGQCLFDLIRSEFDYLFCFDTNIQKLQTQLRKLKSTREGVQLWAVKPDDNLKSVPGADAWLIEANNKIAEADAIIESAARVQTACLKGWCWPRYSLSRKAAIITPDLVHLQTEGIEYTRLSNSIPSSLFLLFGVWDPNIY
ncbi:hypothetical protein LOK49_LG12G02575 [Camellia lanceoleosa]|uniref:Uncharacterized protein n=1 Tax=Camellia lanceoleosa TaxID=1840588 RepID=A0ACC0FU77_9ERIC|nr:hypothetical protein LOK49_LG12G02575 [Camellia lanceoleosa]